MQLIKEQTAVKDYKMMWYSFIKDGIKHGIRGVSLQDYRHKHNKDRNKQAKVIRILRKSNYQYTDLKGILNKHPLKFFRDHFQNGSSIETLCYNPEVREWWENHKRYSFWGYLQDADLISIEFNLTIYDHQLYRELLELIAPHIQNYVITEVDTNYIILDRPTS